MLFDELTVILDPEAHCAPLNMAIDEALLHSARTPLLRIYHWLRPAVSFGYFEKFTELGTALTGREAVRRWTGGGVVLHGEDITYTLIVPTNHPFARLPARESYRQIHEHLAIALRRDGFDPQLAPATATKISSGCFENAAEADVLVGGLKIAGAAQRRTRQGLLHQGSIQSRTHPSPPLAAALATRTTSRMLDHDELTAAARIAAEKYATDAWMRRF